MKKENAIAFGDGSNDIEMPQAVGIGVTMGNATEDVKAAADVIAGMLRKRNLLLLYGTWFDLRRTE
ncbi:MAG: HAD hydrolase family protein [Anaerobutyricum sp.]